MDKAIQRNVVDSVPEIKVKDIWGAKEEMAQEDKLNLSFPGLN